MTLNILLKTLLDQKYSLEQIAQITTPLNGKSWEEKERIAARLLEEIKYIEPERNEEDEEDEEEDEDKEI